MMKYTIIERKNGSDGMPGIELENGLRFVVNNISFDDLEPILSFDYDLLCNPSFPKEDYEKMIGDWIKYVLECAVEDDTLDKMM